MINGRRKKTLRVVGIALSPEYIYSACRPGGMMPDDRRFGVSVARTARPWPPPTTWKGRSTIVALDPGTGRPREKDVIVQSGQLAGTLWRAPAPSAATQHLSDWFLSGTR